MKPVYLITLLLGICSVTLFPAQASTSTIQLGKSPLKEVINALTPEEKVSLVLGTGMALAALPDSM